MGRIAGAFIFPHPPIMVEEVGKRETMKVRSSIDGALEASERIADISPDTVVIITPHGTLLKDAMTIAADERLEGSLARFGAPGVKLSFDNDLELIDKIMEQADKKGTYCAPMHEDVKKTYGLDPGLDHGAMVPLYFLDKKYKDFKLVHITYSLLPKEQHYKLGIAIRDAAMVLDRKVVVIASGDLSHRLTQDAPAGFDPRGAEYDQKYTGIIREGKVKELMSMQAELLEAAGECAYNSTLVLMGCLDGCSIKGEVLSYEGPFGVGYCIAEVHSEACEGRKAEKSSDPYVKLAIDTLETYVRTGKQLKVPESLPAEMLTGRAGVFVSLKKYGELRGCIGTIGPTTINIAMEIIRNAISAGVRDPRFLPVEEDELSELDYSVDVLMEPEPIKSKEELDVKKYGVIVRSGRRSGLLLPNLEGVDTVDYQVDIALQKAGIRSNEVYEMERFEVIRHY
ncbi:MAG TPA: AmmeMemoRadiSam system protein A [Clostridia bacterium]|nr:AmmeMemoRadiSam system protein A [Clostridia bacterium]